MLGSYSLIAMKYVGTVTSGIKIANDVGFYFKALAHEISAFML